MLISTKNPLSIDFKKVNEYLTKDLRLQQELIGSDRMEAMAHELAHRILVQNDGKKISQNLIDEIKSASSELLESYLLLTEEAGDTYLTPASVWFLDNFHIIEDQIRSIKRDLPKDFYHELPKIKGGEFEGYPRVYSIAQTIVTQGDARLETENIEQFITSFQQITPLTIGEIWAVAITLRISLIQRLLPLVRRILTSLKERENADKLADELLELAVNQTDPSNKIVERLRQCLCHADRFSRPFIVQLIQRLRDQDPEVFKSIEWLEETLTQCHTSTNEVIQIEHYRLAADQVSVGNIITSMRLFSNIDWHDFFEKVSLVDPILARDPMNIYSSMDMSTRDSYRKVIERLSKRSLTDEIAIAKMVLTHAEETRQHVGFFLIEEGVQEIESQIQYRITVKERWTRLVDRFPGPIYFGSLISLMLISYLIVINYFRSYIDDAAQTWGIIFLLLIPLSELSLSLLNYVITLVRRPRRLPRMDYKDGIPKESTSMVVVPCMFTSSDTIKELVHNLEVQYLANQDENIYFALLGDLKDADFEIIQSDSELLALAHFEISELNVRYPHLERPRFYVFHRARLFNPSEGKWMGWERKRGKIQEFNRLLRGSTTTSYLDSHADADFLKTIKYVITLDADTQLPLQTARRLIGTITHPKNTPVIDPQKNIVIKGFGIIQPRISISLVSAAKTRFSQIFSGNTGIDPYTTAVSDVYQDLFGEGSFTGKGLYDVDVFEKVIGGRVPENCILSHDLFEGSYARVALATDLELIDDYPSEFETFCKRLHRWTRGDWQLLPWLFPQVKNEMNLKARNDLPLVARWKILDNLRRSILAPVTLIWLLHAWLILPGPALIWTLGIVFTMSCPVFASTLKDLIKTRHIPWPEHIRNNLHSGRNRMEQVFLMVVYMPEVAFAQIDAIFRSLIRMTMTKKKMLEWVTFSQLQNQKKTKRWRELITMGPIFGLVVGIILFIVKPTSLLIALPFILTWLMTPYITHGTQAPLLPLVTPLSEEEKTKFRRYARLTWHFFETFAGKEENWLAPDNFQEDPRPVVAHRTSPTNMGLQLLANLSAFDFGFIGLHDFLEKTENIFETLHKLEQFNGHFFNWYNTQTLEPLSPRYVSTVDSGNLAGHLITLKQACLELAKGTYKSGNERQGLKDTFSILEEYLKKLHSVPYLARSGSVKRFLNVIQKICQELDEMNWDDILIKINESKKLIADFDLDEKSEVTQKIQDWINAITNQISSFKRDESIDHAKMRMGLKTIAYQAHELAHAMDFKFLFDKQRKIFVVGHNVTESRRDDSFYDLLASESRLASFFAISKGDIPDEHWFRLGRQLTNTVGSRALISWSATMFEYLMPLLVMKRYEETLLDQTYESVVQRQIEYGGQRQIPWGVSEAGYNARDLQYNYQYGPFGIPGLGLKRGLRDELVVSPYSSMLAAMVFPREALANLENLEKMGALGRFGFYEAIDYTSERIPKNKKSVTLQSYMAHHQGMSLLSLNNLIHQSILQKRFHADARNQAIQLLLQERIPAVTEITKPRAEETHVESFARFSDNHHTRIYNNPSLSTPRTQILSNGTYSTMVTSAGSGFAKCQGKMINRWREDPTCDNWGQYFYIKNISTGKIWSSGHQPSLTKAKKYEAIFSEDKIDLYREDDEVITNTEIIVSTEDNVELRKVSLTNKSSEFITIEVTSFLEISMAKKAEDSAHPTFSKLFIQTEFNPSLNTLLAERRPRSGQERETWTFHSLIVEGETIGEIEYETDRSQFLGRGRTVHSAQAIWENQKLTQNTGAVLDPIFSIRQKVRIPPKRTAHLIYTTGMAASKDEAIKTAIKYHDQNIFPREVNLGWIKSQIGLRHLNISMEKAHLYQRLASRLLYLTPYLRAQSQILAQNRKQQSALWAYGISGDFPILLVRIHEDKDVPIVRDLLHAHEYLRLKGFIFDLVILNEHSTSYLQTLQDEVIRQILMSGGHNLIDQPGGIFVRRSDLIHEEDLNLIKTVARINIIAERGTLEDQLGRRTIEKTPPSLFNPIAQKRIYPQTSISAPELTFFNGFGGFTKDGEEYAIHLKNNNWTPAPWINVIANKNNFGFIVSECGQGYSWSQNSRENRISSWSNDPVSDHCSEAIYIRDEETGSFWSPTPLPVRSSHDYLIRHGQGYSQFEHCSHGIHQIMTQFVPIDHSVKILRLVLKNESGRIRKLSMTSYIEWVLGTSHESSLSTIVPTWDPLNSIIMVKNTFNNEFAERISFMAMNSPASSFTCDRKEFIGRNGTMASPEAMKRINLAGKDGPALDPCGAIQTIFELRPLEEKEIIILIGQASSAEENISLTLQYRDSIKTQEAFDQMKAYWRETLGVIEIKTPDLAMNLLVNRWLLYQTLTCRFWARSAFYQSGGAFGFRDQLQDIMALIYSHPEITREHILNAASRQFPEGDVQHWWHPPTGRGVRTRFADDLLWLPYVLSFYLEVTGDHSILHELVPFIDTSPLLEGEDETYTQPTTSSVQATIYEHCTRAIDRSLKVGSHGLPLFGSGDWNDGMNRVGHEGQGESVWMAWFLGATMKAFLPSCELMKDFNKAETYKDHLVLLKKSVEENAWDGEWYLRAYFDNGSSMGSHLSDECQIDSIAQSWAILSGLGDTKRSRQAMESVDRYLIQREQKIIKLFTPPFDKSAQDPGYIKGYVPGVRENGGQYTHAAIWTMMAFAELKDSRAFELYSLMNPINHCLTSEDVLTYKVEPYVISADIYGVSPHIGRGGWSWYTGSASWMYRAAIETLLGFKVSKGLLSLRPCLPKEWSGFELTFRRGRTTYEFIVVNHQPEDSIILDGMKLEESFIPDLDDGLIHQIKINLQSPS